ncbi:MAG TPA: LacI family DNA-binding transcriptional regulator [Roseiflexaceae bacterium]|nr:LacI family DNA-binding transcriptional regulator [Roseiflexaceae bacterium]
MSDSNDTTSTRPITSVEVARLAGVSQSTVSRVFSEREGVSSATTLRVREVARKLGYKPNALASSLITRRTNMIGVVMAEISSPFYPYVLEKLTQQLHDCGKQVLLFSTAPGKDVDDVLPDVLRYKVDGLIVANAVLHSTLVEECVQLGTPLLLFNRYVRGAHASAVSCDNVAGGRMVADVLLDAGYTRLAYIAGKANTSTNLDREQGFVERLRERCYDNLLREQASYTYESGFAAAERLLARADRPDAIFCANDIMALGAIDAARAAGIAVPDQLSVIGFDDIPAASWGAYSLTTVRQPVNAMIDLSVRTLLERIETPDMPPTTTFVPGRLVRRGSARLVGNEERRMRNS